MALNDKILTVKWTQLLITSNCCLSTTGREDLITIKAEPLGVVTNVKSGPLLVNIKALVSLLGVLLCFGVMKRS